MQKYDFSFYFNSFKYYSYTHTYFSWARFAHTINIKFNVFIFIKYRVVHVLLSGSCIYLLLKFETSITN